MISFEASQASLAATQEQLLSDLKWLAAAQVAFQRENTKLRSVIGANQTSMIVFGEMIVTSAKLQLDLADSGLRGDEVAEGLIRDDTMSRMEEMRGEVGELVGEGNAGEA